MLNNKKDTIKKINKLKKEYKENEQSKENLEWQVSNLLSEVDNLESDNNLILYDIEKLEERLNDSNFVELDNKLTGDFFRDSFIKATHFCKINDIRNNVLQYVSIGKDEILAVDGYKGIIIECDLIPDNLKDTYIKWDVRENFKEHAIHKESSGFNSFDLKKVFKESTSDIVININKVDFNDKFTVKTLKNQEIALLEYENKKAAFNKEALELILEMFKDEDITIYFPKGILYPIVFKNNYQKIILFPMRINDLEE